MAEQTKFDTTTQVAAEVPPGAAEGARRPAAEWQAPEPPASRSRAGWIIAALVVIALAVGGYFVLQYMGTYEATDDAQVDGHVNALSARVAGYVTEVDVDDNQYVERGMKLVQIDPRDYQVAVEKAKADLADAEAAAQASNINVPVENVNTASMTSVAEANVAGAQAALSAAQQQADAARSQLQAAQANNVRAQADLTRYRTLLAKDETSQQIYDQADAAAKANAAAVDSARAGVAAAEQQVMQGQSRIAQAEANLQGTQTGPQQVQISQAKARAAAAQVEQKKAVLDQAELNLQYCTVVAPVSGVASKSVEVGNNIQPGQTVVSIVPLDDIWITANFKETQLAHMRKGQRVTIAVDAFSREYHGKIESIAGASGARFSLLPPENATGNYVKVVQRVPVKIVLDPGENKDHLLRLGMSVEPKVYVNE
jgi:membrane fusion protein (multidrug efflux system)